MKKSPIIIYNSSEGVGISQNQIEVLALQVSTHVPPYFTYSFLY